MFPVYISRFLLVLLLGVSFLCLCLYINNDGIQNNDWFVEKPSGRFSASNPIKQEPEGFAGSISQPTKSKWMQRDTLFKAYNHPKEFPATGNY